MPAFDFEYLPQDEQALSDLQAAPLPILIPILHINVICLARVPRTIVVFSLTHLIEQGLTTVMRS